MDARLTQDFAALAENYSEDTDSAPNGGDLGFVPMSAFERSSPEVRKLIAGLQPGQVSPILPDQQGYRILRVISRSPTDVQPVFETISESAARLCQSKFCSVYRFDGNLIHFAAQHGMPPYGRMRMVCDASQKRHRAYASPKHR